MKTNRRRFLGHGSAVVLGAMPSLVSRAVMADEGTRSNRNGKILVVIQMSGGNDGINTIIPYADEGYAMHRKKLRLPTDRLLKINDSVGFHPSMRSAADLLEQGKLGIVQCVGYPNPSRSHDTSMAIWHSAQVGDEDVLRSHGWLGMAMDAARKKTDDPDMILVGDESQPLAIQSRRSTAVTLSSLTDLRLRQPAHAQPKPTSDQASESSLAQFVDQTMQDAIATASALERNTEGGADGSAKYPTTRIGRRMQTISTMVKSGFQTPIYYAIQSGYDTHAAQLPSHSRLLREFSDATKAFLDDIEASGLSDQVCVMGFSEFGRRVAENNSEGTDHGTAGPVFLAGNRVRSGLIGTTPKLTDLVDGDLQMSTDFRNMYQEVTQAWLGISELQAAESPSSLKLFDA
ncbi:DUF1501 domain-containing protein [Rhodopirellula bahusiensis]|uniref:Twin-arginine translocation pathway signal sequence domain protein n=1 Tax=Rhodopirellula bahusiensis TaxID=2014065 RepID=A0A2G1VXV8_9BACT|nr:DUF1501 domain-containing protein [Rhodopirellula bahusiensis]PHQ31585.1 Twin-arginine translocation pathway signal sequence domain protein [Rhodopirellula bahusiensis]